MTGLAPSTLSKVENKQISLTYDNLAKLADGLNIDLADLFTPETIQAATGRRSVTRIDARRVHDTPNYTHGYIGAELSRKAMVPIVTRVKAHSLQAFGDLQRHSGEEVVCVMEGTVEFHSEFYEPVVLEVGDCVYFDASMGHALVSIGAKDAQVFSVVSRNPNGGAPQMAVRRAN
jgi:transcriptional regulator with XRE-family HTH domain